MSSSEHNFNLLADGGPMVWVLLLMAGAGAMMFAERTLYLHRAQIRPAAFLAGLKNILGKRRIV